MVLAEGNCMRGMSIDVSVLGVPSHGSGIAMGMVRLNDVLDRVSGELPSQDWSCQRLAGGARRLERYKRSAGPGFRPWYPSDPWSVLLNMRGFVWDRDIVVGKDTETLKLMVGQEAQLWVVDGAERIVGLKLLQKENPEGFAGCMFPAIIGLGWTEEEELATYFQIHSNSRSIPEELRLETRAVALGGASNED